MTEKFDILNIKGESTGVTANKGAQLQDGQYYLGVHVYIYSSAGEFLLQQRSYNKNFLPGGWDVILEHIMANESSIEGAARGVKEEMGLSVPEGDIRFSGRFIWSKYHHIIDVYFAKVNFGMNELSLQNEEVIAAKMVSKDDMLELVSKMDYRPVEYRRHISYEISKLVSF